MQDHTPELIQSQLPFDEIPYGYCHCGCDQKTKTAKQTSKKAGYIKGDSMTYIKGHHARIPILDPGPNPTGLCMCGCGQKTPLAPHSNKTAGIVRGKPIRFVYGHQSRINWHPPAEQRFWAKVDKRGPDECWPWTASTYTSGYGQFWTGTHLTGAHRFAYSLAHGPIPDGMMVLHKCDYKLCCNDAHHFLGTQQDNVDDLMAKGRNNQAKGEKQRCAKFTNDQVIRIRQLFSTGNYTQSALARQWGVSAPAIRCIVLRMTWKHI